jgi:hypothetical protein
MERTSVDNEVNGMLTFRNFGFVAVPTVNLPRTCHDIDYIIAPVDLSVSIKLVYYDKWRWLTAHLAVILIN